MTFYPFAFERGSNAGRIRRVFGRRKQKIAAPAFGKPEARRIQLSKCIGFSVAGPGHGQRTRVGAGSRDRTGILSLEGCCTTIVLYPRRRETSGRWWRRLDSNQRRHSQRVYSPSPLATRALLRNRNRHRGRQLSPQGLEQRTLMAIGPDAVNRNSAEIRPLATLPPVRFDHPGFCANPGLCRGSCCGVILSTSSSPSSTRVR